MPRPSQASMAGPARYIESWWPQLTVIRNWRAVLEELEGRRLHGLGGLAGQLAESGHLRSELSVEEARDLIWTLCSTTVHDLLVRERRWTSERYRAWLAAALKRELLTGDQLPASD